MMATAIRVGEVITDKTPDQIREVLSLESDFTQEEENELYDVNHILD